MAAFQSKGSLWVPGVHKPKGNQVRLRRLGPMPSPRPSARAEAWAWAWASA